MNFRTIALAMMAGTVALTACSTHVSHNISADGVAGEVVFPDLDRIVLEQGTYPTVEAISQIGPGVTKDQLYQLLGRPHFQEGFAGVKEWDYLFHVRTGNHVRSCQYKVIFDKEYTGRSFHWLPADCEALFRPQESVAPVAPANAAAASAAVSTFRLSGDALFQFGRYGLGDIQPGGQRELSRIADELAAPGRAERIEVVGHTDSIGDREQNVVLSQKRADTVRTFLIGQGVSADRISARGVGMAAPVVTCAEDVSRSELIRCLQPNRRVDITVTGAH